MAQSGGQGMNNLTTLIKRLEAATSRLEDIAGSATSLEQQQHHPQGSISAIVSGGVGENAEQQASRVTPGSRPSPSQRESTTTVKAATVVKEERPPSIEAIDELLEGDVEKFVAASKGLDALVEEQASAVAKAFADQRRFLVTSTKAKKPDPQSPAFMELLTDLQQDMSSVGDIRDSHRASPLKEHLAMVAEGIAALQWLLMDGKPADFVAEVIGGAQMYGNRVLKTYKESDPTHVKYVQSYYALLKALHAYIKKHYPTGVTWNNNGIDAAQAYREAASSVSPTATTNGTPSSGPPPPSGGAPPPPPPPLPVFDNGPPPPPVPAQSNKAGTGDMGAVFDQLNRGESVTSGLKKVDKSQMTHKNPSLRASSTVPAAAGSPSGGDITRSRSPGPGIKPKPANLRQNSSTTSGTASPSPPQQKQQTAPQQKKAPRQELDGNKWLIENFSSPASPIELDVTLNQSVLITNCTRTTILLRGKANALSISDSPRAQLLVETLVSSIDVIRSPGIAVQVTGALPTILLDQVDGATIYLGGESLATEIFTSKCSAVNVVLPPPDDEREDGSDSTEVPLPEQIRTFIRDGKVISEIVEHAG